MEKHSWQLIKFYSLYFQSRLYRAVRQDRHLRDGETIQWQNGSKKTEFPKEKVGERGTEGQRNEVDDGERVREGPKRKPER